MNRIINIISVLFAIVAFVICILFFTSEYEQYSKPCIDVSIGRQDAGLYTREIGIVRVQNQDCKIIETYQLSPCYKEKGERCLGEITYCNEPTVLTRLTFCPSFTHENQIDQVYSGKILHEEVK